MSPSDRHKALSNVFSLTILAVVLGVALGWFALAIASVAEEERTVNGRVETIGGGDNKISVLHLWGTPYEIGYAHGRLCSEEVRDFLKKTMPLMQFGLQASTAKLDQIYAGMQPFIPKEYEEEMRGLADGAGVSFEAVKRGHILPDLSEFHCTFFAAHGKATPNGDLIQIRALDYATQAHIQDHPALIITHPERGHAFVNVGWLGFIGCVSGMNDEGIAVSEIGDSFGEEHETLVGEPMPFLLRDVLERAASLKGGVRIIRKAHRTSSYLYAIGDGQAKKARALVTAKDFCRVYDDKSLPFPGKLKDTVYMSMGTDSPWNVKVHAVLKANWGHIDPQVGMREVMTGLGTGNLHAVAYDATNLRIWVANAGRDQTPAYKREYVEYDLRKAFKAR
ncbi:MAG: hypothetical protein HY318_13325 [Armatimonadetes bacterium]|nr:hypothetical protein [Armatimonadota bacterium]